MNQLNLHNLMILDHKTPETSGYNINKANRIMQSL